jgi:hypothetical protein
MKPRPPSDEAPMRRGAHPELSHARRDAGYVATRDRDRGVATRRTEVMATMRRVILIGTLLSAGLPAAVSAETYSATPADYQEQVNQLAPGDTLELAAGTYTDGLSIRGKNGTKDAWITIRGPSEGAPAVFVAKAGRNTIELRNSSYVALQRLKVDGRHKAGLFGLSAKDGASNRVHHIRVEDCTFVAHDGSQNTCAISTKTPTWGWEIRRNVIRNAGTGMYLGNSDGTQPFIGGLIENNLVVDPLGYCIQVKYQKPRPDHPGIPAGVSQTLIRHNVLIKNNKKGPSGARPNLLVGGFPRRGPGKDDLYQIYGNLIVNNPFDALIQASGRVVIHDNILVGATNTALVLRNHDLPLDYARVYSNTIYGGSKGISVGNSPAVSQVVGNLIFAKAGISGTIADKRANIVASISEAGSYVVAPSFELGKMNFYPLPGTCEGPPIDPSVMQDDPDFDRDFDGQSKGDWTFRGAYATSDEGEPRWALARARKDLEGSTPPPQRDAGVGNAADGSPSAPDGGVLDALASAPTPDGSAGSSETPTLPTTDWPPTRADAGTNAETAAEGGGCATGAPLHSGLSMAIVLLALLTVVRRRRFAR